PARLPQATCRRARPPAPRGSSVDPLLDHIVRLVQKSWRDGEPESLGGLEIDHQGIPCRLFEGQLARLGPLEDLVDVRRGAPEVVRRVRAIVQETTGLGIALAYAYRGQSTLERLRRDGPRFLHEERI